MFLNYEEAICNFSFIPVFRLKIELMDIIVIRMKRPRSDQHSDQNIVSSRRPTTTDREQSLFPAWILEVFCVADGYNDNVNEVALTGVG